MKILDSILFNNEIDLLKVRLSEHYNFVDKFYIMEATKTFSYIDKPSHYLDNKHLFKEWEDKIEHVLIDADEHFIDKSCMYADDQTTLLINQNIQRRWMFNQRPKEYDYMLLMDCDEIIMGDRFKEILTLLERGYKYVQPRYRMFYYFINHETSEWMGRGLHKIHVENDDIHKKDHAVPSMITGWHFSHLGGVEKIKQKILNNAFYNKLKKFADEEHIIKRLKGLNYMYDKGSFGTSSLHANMDYLSKYMLDNWDVYSKYTYEHFLKESNER